MESATSGGGSLKPHQGLTSGVLGHKTLAWGGVKPGMDGDMVENDSREGCFVNKLGEEVPHKPGEEF